VAIDTRDKRFAMIGFASPVPMMMENPDATDDAAGRVMGLNLYPGITLQDKIRTLLSGVTQSPGVGDRNVWLEEGLGEQTSVDRKNWVLL